jgi:hypothetical protein
MKPWIAIILIFATNNLLAENIPYDQATKVGIKKCLPAIKKMTNFVIEDGNHGAHSIWNSDTPDSSGFSTIIERNFSDGTIVTNVVVAPTANGKCYAEYQRVFNVNKSCIAMSRDIKNSEYKAEINKEVSYLKQGDVAVYLLPNGTQCTVIRKEIIMNANK